MKKTLMIYALFAAFPSLISCEEKPSEAAKLLEEIRADYEAGKYDDALLGIDSLRHAYPEAVKERKEALIIHQQASLVQAQQHLACIDSTLQVVEREYNSLKPVIEERHNNGTATRNELHHFNLLRAQRDSLQGVFNMECAKIKYIHKRQKEAEEMQSNDLEKE